MIILIVLDPQIRSTRAALTEVGDVVLTLIFFPGWLSTSCMAMSLQDLRLLEGTLLSSSQYLEAEWENRAAGVAWVTLVVVTIPVHFPVE